MTEMPRPVPESRETQPKVSIFSNAEVDQDGKYVDPAFQVISDLWRDEIDRRRLPGDLRRTTTTTDNKTTVSLHVTAKTLRDEEFFNVVNQRIHIAVEDWVVAGRPSYRDIKAFRKEFMSLR